MKPLQSHRDATVRTRRGYGRIVMVTLAPAIAPAAACSPISAVRVEAGLRTARNAP
jgi:hypothetical protein